MDHPGFVAGRKYLQRLGIKQGLLPLLHGSPAASLLLKVENIHLQGIHGEALAIEKSLPPFPKKAWRAGKTEEDGDILPEIPDWSIYQ